MAVYIALLLLSKNQSPIPTENCRGASIAWKWEQQQPSLLEIALSHEEMSCKHSTSALFVALIPYMIRIFVGSQVVVATNTLLTGQYISGSETLVSENGVFQLGFFCPVGIKNYLGIQYRSFIGSNPTTFWLALSSPLISFTNASLHLNASGELYIEDFGYVPWTSNSTGIRSDTAEAVLLNNGNFIVRGQLNSSNVIWQSFDHPTDALLPGARLGLDMAIGANISLTFSKPPYYCRLMLDQRRKRGFVMLIGAHFYMGTFPDWMVTYEKDGKLIRLSDPTNPNDFEIMRLQLGQVSLLRRVDNATFHGWLPLWSYPSSCRVTAYVCGPFGVCTSAGTCKCIDGFSPTKPNEWKLGLFVSGCSRITPSKNCEGGISTDSFVLLDNLQGLPDNPEVQVEASSEECQAACLNNCYCVAYSYHSGCKIWQSTLYNLTVVDYPPYIKIYMRIGSQRKKGKQIKVVISVIVPIAIALTMLLLLGVYKRFSPVASQIKVEGFLDVYSYAQLKKATKNFSEKLGEGSFGSVFKGTVARSNIVAVKKLKGLVHRDKQFRTEVQTIGMIQHTNLVHLLGFCAEKARRLLVYEYMINGSLDAHLFSESSRVLSWNLRYQIVLGISKGLAYLHEECRSCIIHCDIKPENILLDAEFFPKIADFGMAKLLGQDFTGALTTIRGTIGYLAPEWISGQPITKKADVYSFGIVLFEIISGRRTTNRMNFGGHQYFPLYAAAQVNEGEVLCLLDVKLEGDANVKELDIACKVACWCIQDKEDNRPSMGQVVCMLEGIVDTEMPPIPESLHSLMEGEDSGIYSEENWHQRTQD